MNPQILYAEDICGIGDNEIKNLNLIKFFATNNPKMTDVNHMNNIKMLDASVICDINNNGIKNLTVLYAFSNSKILNI
jgi:hypothetical protein